MVNFANAPGTNANKRSQETWYIKFTSWFKLTPYPVNEWRLVLYARYLSLTITSVQTIKTYCGLVCELHELQGFEPVRHGMLYAKAIKGIRQLLHHEVKQAQPITLEMLKEMVHQVDVTDLKQLAIWVTILFGFYLFLRKSNLAPVICSHDPVHQLSRCDIKYYRNVLVAEIKWSKTNQFGEDKIRVPVVREGISEICLVEWLLYMVHRTPAQAHHNLFSFPGENGKILPVTYKDLTEQLHTWLGTIGELNIDCFSTHSLRRGGITQAFNRRIPEITIQ